jgi:predicted amidohydrolase YtcJ
MGRTVTLRPMKWAVATMCRDGACPVCRSHGRVRCGRRRGKPRLYMGGLMKHLLPFAFALVLAGTALAQSRPAADLIIRNAKIWTVDRDHPEAEAVAILGDRIVAVGSNQEIDAWRGSNTQIIDAAGKRLLPGFNDAHVHFTSGGQQLDNVQLNDATSPQEFARRVAERAKKTAKDEWIVGGDWDETKWTPAQLPTKDLIDPLTPQTPVALDRYDGHMILANALALKLAGITAKTPDPDGGVIVHDTQGNPTGALKDAAADLVYKVIPDPTHDQRRHSIERALEHAASVGVTSVQHMNPDYADIAIYAELLQEGKLTTRIYAAPLISQVDDQVKIGIRHAFGGPYLRIGALKAYADGSLGSATAYFFEPFNDQPGNRGLLSDAMHPISMMRDRMMKADADGLQLCTHAIGDAGISAILDIYAEVDKAHGPSDRRWRIEHAQHMAAKDFDRFAQLHVIASVQPYHAIDDGRWAEGRIGHDRSSRTYAFRTFLNHGVRLALGTDWNVAPLNPMLTLYAATTRATLDGKNPNGWFPEQKLTIREAIDAYTMGSAYAEFQENVKGSITPGKLADMVLLSDDVLTIDPVKIRDVTVLKTWVGGKLTYETK